MTNWKSYFVFGTQRLHATAQCALCDFYVTGPGDFAVARAIDDHMSREHRFPSRLG